MDGYELVWLGVFGYGWMLLLWLWHCGSIFGLMQVNIVEMYTEY